MSEQELEITQNGEYKNIRLKPNLVKGLKGLEYDNYIIVEKTDFAEGMEFNGQFGKSYSCRVTYKDEQVSFWLNEREHTAYKGVGGVGDKVKITLFKHTFTNPKTGMEGAVPRLKFELVE